jgi:hypothetical protein
VSNVTTDATKSAEKVLQQTADAAGKPPVAPQTSFLTVEVVGLGEDDDERKRQR